MPGQEFDHPHADPHAPHRQPVAQRPAHEPRPRPPHHPFAERFHRRRFVDRPMAQMDQLVRDVDLHRADLAARAAQRRGEGQLAGLSSSRSDAA